MPESTDVEEFLDWAWALSCPSKLLTEIPIDELLWTEGQFDTLVHLETNFRNSETENLWRVFQSLAAWITSPNRTSSVKFYKRWTCQSLAYSMQVLSCRRWLVLGTDLQGPFSLLNYFNVTAIEEGCFAFLSWFCCYSNLFVSQFSLGGKGVVLKE